MIDCLKQRLNYHYGCILYTPLRLYGTGWISDSQLHVHVLVFHLALMEDDAATDPITFVCPYPRAEISLLLHSEQDNGVHSDSSQRSRTDLRQTDRQ